MPTENFFYSHTYGFLYGMPTTLDRRHGDLQGRQNDTLLVNAGLDTGWNNFTALNGKANAMFGVNWTSGQGRQGQRDLRVVHRRTCRPAGIDGTRTECCTDITVKLGDKKKVALYLGKHRGHDSNQHGTGGPASWTGWTNYLLYDINDCWGFGIRYEYFEDLDGAVVPGVGLLGESTFYPSTVPVLGSKYNDVTIGLNWKPNKNVTVRSEVRWDWAENSATAGVKPFGDGNSNSQFLWGNDVVVRF